MLHRAIWKRELMATLSLGLPLVLTNLAQIAMTVTDVLFIGRLGAQALAASALGANLFAAVQFFAFGLVNATAPMVARSLGARSNAVRDVRRTVRQGLWTVIIVSVPGCALLWFGSDILLAMGQPHELAAMAGEYLRALMWAMPPFLAYIVLRSFAAAMNRPRSALWAALAGIALNAVLNWIFVFGHLGMPALGLIGAGLGSSLASLGMLLIMVGVVLRDRQFRRFRLFGDFFQSDRQRLAAFWKLGLPIAAATAFEVTIFNAAAFLMGWLGQAELAAHAIAIQIAAVSFMVPFGFAQVATVRVGHAFGAGDAAAASRAGWMAFVVGISAMVVTASLMLLLPYTMIGAFIDMQDPANAAVIPLAVAFLAVAALFQIVDGAQVLGAGMLRGLHDTRVPMTYAAIGYWGVGLPAGAMLAFWGGWRGVGIWSGLAIGLGVVSVLMMQRWLRRDALKLAPRPMT